MKSFLQVSLTVLLVQTLIATVEATRSESFFKTDFGRRAKLKHMEEWLEWKEKHRKSYGSSLEELERHFIWLSNRRYIEHHNNNSHIFGFTLAMNHLGDMVRECSIIQNDRMVAIAEALLHNQ